MDCLKMYTICLNNSLRGHEHTITYINGLIDIGIPSAGSCVLPSPDAIFSLKIGDIVKTIRFGDVFSIVKN